MERRLPLQHSMISETTMRKSGLLSTVLCFVALFLPMALNGAWPSRKVTVWVRTG